MANKFYTKEEDDAIRDYYAGNVIASPQTLLEGRTNYAIRHRANALGLKKYCQQLPTDVKPIPDIKAAYFAGHFDGDGCVGLYKHSHSNTYTPVVAVRIAHKPVLDEYAKYFGRKVLDGYKAGLGDLKMWRWTLNGLADCLYFLKTLEPYLIEKKEQVVLTIEWLEWRLRKPSKMRYTQDSIEYSERLAQRIKSLKSVDYQ
jgi:hypothetical protein